MTVTTATLDPLTHTYTNGSGETLDLSVTRVLELSGVKPAYPEHARPFVEHAGELGGVTHEWTEYWDRAPEHRREVIDILRENEEESLPLVIAYSRFGEDHDYKWDFIEMGYSRDDVAGTPDRIGVVDGQIAIVDIKTSKKPARHWQLQLTGYQWLCGIEEAKPKLYVLHLAGDATYRLLPYEADMKTWMAALEVARWKVLNRVG